MTEFPWARLRSDRYDEIIVSPHMDDAVYSCAGRIAQRRREGARVLVVTVFGNGSDDEAGSGVFGNITQRKAEERAAMDLLDIDHAWLNVPDLIVRKKSLAELLRYTVPFATLAPTPLQRDLLSRLTELRATYLAPAGKLWFPLAIGAHPDHRLVFEVGAHFAGDEGTWFYEDIPYAEVPALREERLTQLGLASIAARWASPSEVHGFVFAHAPAWQRPFTWLAVFGFWCTMQLFARVRPAPLRAEVRASQELPIDDARLAKEAAMRAYVTQTDYFYPRGIALTQSGGRYVERAWQLAFPAPPAL